MKTLQRTRGRFCCLDRTRGRFYCLDKAQELGARVFSVPTDTWNAMTRQEQWNMNKQFLDESISMGHQFIMSNSANMAQPGTFFYQEVQYLLEQGYQIIDKTRGRFYCLDK